jgi:membrane protease subunit (stomatin/prohibitin family)
MARIIDVIEFVDETGREIIHREPEGEAFDIRFGSQLIVRPSQVAIFFRDGQALDSFGPGRHTLTSANIPILAGLIGMATGGRTPFPAEVLFVNMRQFVDQKWGTSEPVTVRDSAFGMIRLRAFGSYAYQVKEPLQFANQIAGQQGIFTTGELENYLRSFIMQRFTDVLGEQQRSLLELAGQFSELSTGVKAQLADDFSAIGLQLSAFYVGSISPTEDTAKAIDERASMGAIGDMDAYMKFKAARAMGDAANNPGGEAGSTVGLGAGVGLGAAIAGAIGQAFQPRPATPAAAAAPAEPAAASGALTRAQVQEAIDALDLRFSKGEIAEETYNRMIKKWEDRLKELGG